MAGTAADRRGAAAPGRPRRPRPDPHPRPRLHAKAEDGSVAALEIADLGDEIAAFDGASSGLLGDDDVEEAGNALEPGTSAALLVFENSWAAPFAAAVRRSGGQLVASGRIPVQDVLAALDAVEASE